MTLFDVADASMERYATVSDDGVYRYDLRRIWDHDTPDLAWIMLNPSTADALTDDPTIRRCIGFAKAWGYGGIVVVNLFAYRATDPDELGRHLSVAIGPDNDAHLFAETATRATVAAWGASVPAYWRHRPAAVVQQLRDRDVALHHLGLTKSGQPRHPLYLAGDTQLTRWTA